MGWFSRSKPPLGPHDLRDALIAAVHAGDDSRLRKLVDANRDAIQTGFPAWQMVPEAIRSDGALMQHYVGGLIGVAQHLEARGDSSLMDLLTGPPEDNPLLRWQQALQSAQAAIAENRYAQAEPALREQVAAGRKLSGSGADRYLPITLGLLGQCRFHQGDAAEALPLFEEARAICERVADTEGELVYLTSLHETQRWLGAGDEAVRLAEQLAARAEATGNQDTATWARGRAARMRAGEPLVRMRVEIDGRHHELEELPATQPGRVRFELERNRLSLGGATALVEEGSRLGSAGDNQRALQAFQAAAALDPFDPQPPYLAGLALMELGRYADAVQSYDTTERLAPGWFHCRADRWLAAELAAGRVTGETFQALRRIEDGDAPPAEKARLAAEAIAAAPGVPALYLLRAEALLALGSGAAAQVVARDGLGRQPDPDVRTRLLVTLAQAVGEGSERTRLLEEAIALEGNRTAAAMARVMMRFA